MNVLFFLATQILYVILLIKCKPAENNKLLIFSESVNLLMIKQNFLKEDDRSNIGCFEISLIGLIFVFNLLFSMIIIFGANKNTLEKISKKKKLLILLISSNLDSE